MLTKKQREEIEWESDLIELVRKQERAKIKKNAIPIIKELRNMCDLKANQAVAFDMQNRSPDDFYAMKEKLEDLKKAVEGKT